MSDYLFVALCVSLVARNCRLKKRFLHVVGTRSCRVSTAADSVITIRIPKLSMGCQTSKDVLPVRPTERRPSINEIFLQAASKQIARDESGVGAGRLPASDSHRDVFSIFGERGMAIDVPRDALASPSSSTCPPISPSGSVFSTANHSSDGPPY